MANAVGELFLNLQVSFHWPINFPHDYNLIQREIYRNLLETFEYRHFLLDWEGGGVIFNVLKKFFDFIQFSLIVIFSHPFLWLYSWADKIWIWTLSLETSEERPAIILSHVKMKFVHALQKCKESCKPALINLNLFLLNGILSFMIEKKKATSFFPSFWVAAIERKQALIILKFLHF